MKPKRNTHDLEFSHTLAVDKIPAAGLIKSLQANEPERQRLAERFGLLGLSNLKADLTVHAARADQTVPVTGHLSADVVQSCVATLEPLPSHIEHKIDVLYTPQESIDLTDGPSTMEIETAETEFIVDGLIDLGELVAQNLGIALDPYPRKPGVGFIEAEYGDDKAAANPFAKLAEWKKKPKG